MLINWDNCFKTNVPRDTRAYNKKNSLNLVVQGGFSKETQFVFEAKCEWQLTMCLVIGKGGRGRIPENLRCRSEWDHVIFKVIRDDKCSWSPKMWWKMRYGVK